jgi:hypothetical protein
MLKMQVCENTAQCVGLTFPKTIEHKSIKLHVGEARFVIATANGLKNGQMLFWNEDAPMVEKLALVFLASSGKFLVFGVRNGILRIASLIKPCNQSDKPFIKNKLKAWLFPEQRVWRGV